MSCCYEFTALSYIQTAIGHPRGHGADQSALTPRNIYLNASLQTRRFNKMKKQWEVSQDNWLTFRGIYLANVAHINNMVLATANGEHINFLYQLSRIPK